MIHNYRGYSDWQRRGSGMGVFKRGKNYWIDYYFNGCRKRESVGTSKSLAVRALEKKHVAIAEGRFLDIKKEQKVRFEDFTDTFLELHSKLHKKSWESDFHIINKLKRFFGGKYLFQITSMLVEEYKTMRIKSRKNNKTLSPATVNREITLLKGIFNKAVEWNKLGSNQISKVKLFKEDSRRLRYLEKEEIVKLLKACDVEDQKRKVAEQGGHYNPHLKSIILVALNTGMRRSEILGLKWHDCNFNIGNITLLNTKNGDKREMPMNDVVKTVLIKVRKHPESPYIFCNKNGEPFFNVRKSFFTALKKAGIINFRFHDLRHTFASQMVMSGVDLNTVRELLGHKSLEMTLVYAHLSPNHKKQGVDVLARQLGTIWTPEPNVKSESTESVVATLDVSKDVKNAPVAHLDRAQVS